MARPSPMSSPRLRLVPNEPTGALGTDGADARISASLDDHELISAVRSGDEAAATLFYRRVRPRVASTLGRMIGAADPDFDDLAQIAFVELVKSIDGFRGDCSLDSWVGRVTAHVVCKQIRRRRVERGIFGLAASEPVDRAQPGGAVVARSVLARIRVHLNAMDPGRAMAFLLHDVCGLDLRETAEALEVSVAAAQKRLVRGRREVRERIAGDPDLAEMLLAGEGSTP